MTKNLILLKLILFSSVIIAQNIDFKSNLISKEKIGMYNRTIKLEGFYYSKHIYVKSVKDSVRSIDPIIFFEDGTFLNFDNLGNGSLILNIKEKDKICALEPRQDFDTIIKYFKCYSEIVKKTKTNSVYSIDKNNIRIQHIGPNFFVEEQGTVLNDSVIVLQKRINYLTKEESNFNIIYKFQRSKRPKLSEIKRNSKIKKYFFK